MVKYYGRARQRVGSVNTNQLGLKMSGCPSKVGRSGRIDRYISRRSHCGIVFCGWVWYHGIKWKQNHWVNPYTKEINWRCIPAAPITRALAGGVGRLNAPRFRCAKNCGRQPWWTWTNHPHSSPRVEEPPVTPIVEVYTIPFDYIRQGAQTLSIYFTEEDGTKKLFTGADGSGQPDQILFDTGNNNLLVWRFEDICPGYKPGAKHPFSSLNKKYKIIANDRDKGPWGNSAFLVQGPISLQCKKTSSSDPVKYWINPTAVFWACNGVSGARHSNCGGGITLPGGGVGTIFRQDHRCKFVEILWRQNQLKLYSNNSTTRSMPNIPLTTRGYKANMMRNIPYAPPPPPWSAWSSPARTWMCIPLASLHIGGVDSEITTKWYNSMKKTIYTYDENEPNTYEAVFALCDTGGGAFSINDPSLNLITTLNKEMYKKSVWCPEPGGTYGTHQYPFPKWSAKFGDCITYPKKCTELTIPAAPNPAWSTYGALICTTPMGCCCNLGAQLFIQYDVIINVQTPEWWEDHIMKPGVTLDGINLGTYRAGATVVQPPPSYYPPNKVPPATGTVATTVENSTTVVVIVTSATVSGYTPKFTPGLQAAPVKIDGKPVGTPKTVSAGQPPPSPWNLYPCQAASWVHADLPGRPPLASDTSGNRFQIGFKRSCPCTTATSPCPPPGYPGACCLSDTQSAPCETQNWTKETCVPPFGTWCDASTTEDVLDP